MAFDLLFNSNCYAKTNFSISKIGQFWCLIIWFTCRGRYCNPPHRSCPYCKNREGRPVRTGTVNMDRDCQGNAYTAHLFDEYYILRGITATLKDRGTDKWAANEKALYAVNSGCLNFAPSRPFMTIWRS